MDVIAATRQIMESRGFRLQLHHLRPWAITPKSVHDGIKPNLKLFPMPEDYKPLHELRAMGVSPYPKGGRTVAEIINPNGVVIAQGESLCSMRDPFDRRLGGEIATRRALLDFKRNTGVKPLIVAPTDASALELWLSREAPELA